MDGIFGADWWLLYQGILPYNYITEKEALDKGWKSWQGNLSKVAPGMIITKGIYENRKDKLPNVPGRIWYEADINYTKGFRGLERILFSNDGLIFVTYDHYGTFVEII